jgi:predicted HicB family RNase H-like nuclease
MDEETLNDKGYTGSMQISIEDNCLYGRVLRKDDLVTYEGQTVEEVRAAFQESVDYYLRTCAERGLVADAPRQRLAALGG